MMLPQACATTGFYDSSRLFPRTGRRVFNGKLTYDPIDGVSRNGELGEVTLNRRSLRVIHRHLGRVIAEIDPQELRMRIT